MTGMAAPRRPSRISQGVSLALLTLALGYAVSQPTNRVLTDWNVCLVGIGLATVVFSLPAASPAPRLERWLAWAVLLIPCYVAWQLLPLPSFLLRLVSPERAWILDNLKPVMQTPAFAPLTISPGTTTEFFLRMTGYTLTFLAIRTIAGRFWERRSWAPAIPLIAVAALEAGFGLWQRANGANGAAVTPVAGNYLNKNHFAGLLEMALRISVAYAIAKFNGERFHRPSPALDAFKPAAALAVAAVLVVALLYSQSKSGLVAALCGSFVMGALPIACLLRGWKRAGAVACFAGLVFLAFVFLPPDSLVGGFGGTVSGPSRMDLEGRWPIWIDTLHLIRDYPLFGSGLGTYEAAFLKYQTAALDAVFQFAHNDYLQLAAELGAVGFMILAGVMGGVFLKALRAATAGSDRQTRYLGLGCAGAMTAIFVHSFADFNMYHPANAMFLAWISGIAASLPSGVRRRAPEYGFPGPGFFRWFAVALGCLLLLYAPAWLVFRNRFWSNPRAEQMFCRFGICDSNAFLYAQLPAASRNKSFAPVSALLETLRREPASPSLWRHLAEALLMSGRVEQARYCFSNALALAPNIPLVLLAAGDFYAGLGDRRRALELASRVLEETSGYDDEVFGWFKKNKVAGSEILSALPPGPRAPRACIRQLIYDHNAADASIVWNWTLAHGYADEKLASQYVAFLIRGKQYEAAARSWAGYLGDRRNGYLQSNWVFNGDFETEPSGEGFDWNIAAYPGVEVARDSSVAHTGSHSLRIRFDGKENVDYRHVYQDAFVTPGAYRFEAFIRTQDITTSQGIGFLIFDAENASRVMVRTEQFTGTNDWKKVEQTIRIPRETRLLQIQANRAPVVLKFDDKIAGTAWIDSVRLSRIE